MQKIKNFRLEILLDLVTKLDKSFSELVYLIKISNYKS
jgi:hypothetical protein